MISKTILGHRKANPAAASTSTTAGHHARRRDRVQALPDARERDGRQPALARHGESLAEDAYDEAAKGIELPEESKTPQRPREAAAGGRRIVVAAAAGVAPRDANAGPAKARSSHRC